MAESSFMEFRMKSASLSFVWSSDRKSMALILSVP